MPSMPKGPAPRPTTFASFMQEKLGLQLYEAPPLESIIPNSRSRIMSTLLFAGATAGATALWMGRKLLAV